MNQAGISTVLTDSQQTHDNAETAETQVLSLPQVRGLWAHVSFLTLLIVFTLCIQSPILAVVLLGWFYAWMQVRGLRHWWRRLTDNHNASDYYLAVHDLEREVLPRFFSRPLARRRDVSADSLFKRSLYYLSMPFAGLWSNVCTGLQALANLSVLLMPSALFWTFSWWGGWNNSFFKGYEAFSVGPTLGLSGIALFIVAMLYVPMAQARHAMSGEWRRFWDVALIRKILAERPVALLLLATLITLMNLPLIMMKSLPFQFSEMIDGYETMSNAEVFAFSQSYYFWCGLYVLAGWFLIKNLIMRIYTSSILRLLSRKKIEMAELSNFEQQALQRLNVAELERHQDPAWKTVVRMPLRVTCCIAIMLVWFGFAAQIYIAQFLKYDGDGYGKGWINQPLLQVPWFNYTPTHLSADEDVSASDQFLGR